MGRFGRTLQRRGRFAAISPEETDQCFLYSGETIHPMAVIASEDIETATGLRWARTVSDHPGCEQNVGSSLGLLSVPVCKCSQTPKRVRKERYQITPQTCGGILLRNTQSVECIF